MSVATVVTAVFVYTMFITFALLVFAGIFGRLMGWSDPSAPTNIKKTVPRNRFDEFKEKQNSVQFRPSFAAIRELKSTRNMKVFEEKNHILEYVLDKWKHHSGVKVAPLIEENGEEVLDDPENPPIVSNITTSVSTVKFDPWQLSYTKTVVTTVKNGIENQMIGASDDQVKLLDKRSPAPSLRAITPQKAQQLCNSLDTPSLDSQYGSRDYSLLHDRISSPQHPHHLAPIPPYQLQRPNLNDQANSIDSLNLSYRYNEEGRAVMNNGAISSTTSTSRSLDPPIGDRIENLENMLVNISKHLDVRNTPNSSTDSSIATVIRTPTKKGDGAKRSDKERSSSRSRVKSDSDHEDSLNHTSSTKKKKKKSFKEIVKSDIIDKNIENSEENVKNDEELKNSQKRNKMAKDHMSKLVEKLKKNNKNSSNKVHIERNGEVGGSMISRDEVKGLSRKNSGNKTIASPSNEVMDERRILDETQSEEKAG